MEGIIANGVLGKPKTALRAEILVGLLSLNDFPGDHQVLTTPPANFESEQQRREKSDRYFRLSQRLLKHAQEQLDLGDTVQASEKAYGAVSHAVKSCAELRGWNHYNHHRVGLVLDQLRDEENDPSLTEGHDAIESLHKNFFEHEMEVTRVKDRVDTARNLIDKLESLRARGPRPLISSTLSQEQRRRLASYCSLPPRNRFPQTICRPWKTCRSKPDSAGVVAESRCWRQYHCDHALDGSRI